MRTTAIELLSRLSGDAVLAFDATTARRFASPEAGRLLGGDASWPRLLGAIGAAEREAVMDAIGEACKVAGASREIEHTLDAGDEPVRVRTRFYNGIGDGQVEHFVVLMREVGAQRLHDPSTGLPGGLFLTEQIRQLVEAARTGGSGFAVLMVQVDDFDALQGTMGSPEGRELLREVAQRLTRASGAGAVLGRLDDGRFVLVCPGMTSRAEAERQADRIQMRMFPAVELNGRGVHLTVSIGIAMGDGRRDADALLKATRLALHSARRGGRSQQATYETHLGEDFMARVLLDQELHNALPEGQLEVHYQPIVWLDSHRLAGYEALLRWRHPIRGMVSPARFIPLAEENGLIAEIGAWVLAQSCRQIKRWRALPRGQDLFVSVNLSTRQLWDPNLLERVRRIVGASGVDPTCVKLELTETAFIGDADRMGKILHELQRMGFQLALDDFGTGYSSLSYLHTMPFETLKVDRSFVSAIDAGDRRREALLSHIIAIGRSLDMSVVAEGVETGEQALALNHLACEYGQGYYFARPLPADEATRLFAPDAAAA